MACQEKVRREKIRKYEGKAIEAIKEIEEIEDFKETEDSKESTFFILNSSFLILNFYFLHFQKYFTALAMCARPALLNGNFQSGISL